jgi:hypothetical protein
MRKRMICFHVTSIFNKLSADNRAQAAAWLARHHTKPVIRVAAAVIVVVWPLLAWLLWLGVAAVLARP